MNMIFDVYFFVSVAKLFTLLNKVETNFVMYVYALTSFFITKSSLTNSMYYACTCLNLLVKSERGCLLHYYNRKSVSLHCYDITHLTLAKVFFLAASPFQYFYLSVQSELHVIHEKRGTCFFFFLRNTILPQIFE